MQRFIRRFVCGEAGATAIEYGLLAALVAISLIAALMMLGDQIGAVFESLRAALM